jgi:hypothetical protein
VSDISLAEFIVYGFVAYSSLLMLIISVVKEIPTTKSLAIARSIFLIPGMVAAAVLASSGVNIQVANVATSNLIKSINTTQTWTETTTQINNIVLQSQVWQMFHMLIFLVLVVYVITQMLSLFLKYDEANRVT